jgi:SHS2 domain-containing protein
MYERFEHTADLGLRIRAATTRQLFAEAGEALLSALVADHGSVRPRIARRFDIEGDDLEYLLVDWLRELLYVYDAEQIVFCRFDVEIDERGLTATARGETVDQARHMLQHEIKAITYHGLRVQPVEAGWLAEVIVDI